MGVWARQPPHQVCGLHTKVCGIELASALTFMKSVPVIEPGVGRKRHISWVSGVFSPGKAARMPSPFKPLSPLDEEEEVRWALQQS